jgi:hypothetical protein
MDRQDEMIHLYTTNDNAAVGDVISCPVCKQVFIKKSYQQKFCGNKGHNNCKDKFWNFTDPKRREYAKKFFGSRHKLKLGLI